MKNALLFSSLLLLAVSPPDASAQTPGEVAPSIFQGFGPDGEVSAAAVQKDGRILIGGYFTRVQDSFHGGLSRLMPNGVVDRSFNPGSGVGGVVHALAVQKDGKILVAGDISNYAGVDVLNIVRINRDGSLDPTFFAQVDDTIHAVLVLPNGKILIGGRFENIGMTAKPYLACLHSDGSLDTSFNGAGIGPDNDVYDMQRQKDGKLVVGGRFEFYNGVASGRVVRLLADGSLDASFAVGAGFNGEVLKLALQKNGGVLVAGDFDEYQGESKYALVRLNQNGSLDAGFPMGGGPWDRLNAVSVLGDGKILIGGNRLDGYGTVEVQRFARLLPSGALDPKFTPFDPGNSPRVNGVLPVAKGGVIVYGEKQLFGDRPEVSLLKFGANGLIDPKFAGQTGVFEGIYTAGGLAGGSVLLAGSFKGVPSLGAANINMTRMLPNGKPDRAFSFTSINGFVNRLETLPDGSALIAGGFTQLGNAVTRNGIAKIQPNGQVDSVFDPGSGFSVAAVRAIVPDATGGLYAAGSFTSFRGFGVQRLVRIAANGTRVAAFDTATAATDTINAMVQLPSGDLVIGGQFLNYKGNPGPRIARISGTNAAQVSALEFNPGTGFNNTVLSMENAQDGGIWVGGQFTSYNGVNRGRIAKIAADGSLRTDFMAAPLVGANNVVIAMAEQADGKLLIGGDFTFVNGEIRQRLARVHADGTLDDSFYPGTGANGVVTQIVIEPGGTALVLGDFTSYDGRAAPGVVRVWLDYKHVATTFAGLGESSSAANRELMGRFTAKLTATGAVSGVLDCPLGKLPIRGPLDSTGRLSTVVTAKSGATVTVSLALGREFTGMRTLEGTATSSSGATVDLTAHAAFYSSKLMPANLLAGTYHTALVPTAPGYFTGSTDLSGFSYLTLRVAATGAVRVVGRSSEGANLTAAVNLTANNVMPLHFDLFKKTGYLQGGLSVFQDSNGPNSRPVVGNMRLLRPAGGAFASEVQQTLTSNGNLYRPRVKTQPIFAASNSVVDSFTVRILGGHIAADASHSATITIPLNGKAVVTGGEINGLKINFNRNTGAITGSFVPPSGGKAVKIQGMIVGPTHARGYALINQGGVVLPAAVLVGP